MILPLPVTLNRFFAPLCVFIFGMSPYPSFQACENARVLYRPADASRAVGKSSLPVCL